MNGRSTAALGYVLIALLALPSLPLDAQGTQAAAHLEHQRAALARDTLISMRSRVLAYTAEREAFEGRVERRAGDDDAEYRRRVSRVVELGRVIRRTPLEDRSLPALLQEFAAEAASLDGEKPAPGTRSAEESSSRGVSPLTLVPAFLGAISPGVSFTLGVGTRPCTKCSEGAEVGTSLVGAALGATVGALGAPDGLKDYFEKNIAMGLTLPTRKATRITSGLSVGLGSVDIFSRGVWPTLGVEQFDSSDVRLPAEVRARNQAQGTWSAPQFGVGFTWYTSAAVKKRLQEKKVVPILSMGVRFPHYYPGSAAAALAALFNGNEHKYESAGSAHFFASLSIPLFRVDGS